MSFSPNIHPFPREKSINEILEAEAGIAKCLKDLLCEGFVDDIIKVDDVEKRSIITHRVVCAYASKEDAMANLVKSLCDCEPYHHHHKCECKKPRPDLALPLILLFLVFTCFRCRCSPCCNRPCYNKIPCYRRRSSCCRRPYNRCSPHCR